MEFGKDIKVVYSEGKLVISALDGAAGFTLDAAKLAIPLLDGLQADFESGKIDLIKNTDLDKVAAVALLEGAKKLVKGL